VEGSVAEPLRSVSPAAHGRAGGGGRGCDICAVGALHSRAFMFPLLPPSLLFPPARMPVCCLLLTPAAGPAVLDIVPFKLPPSTGGLPPRRPGQLLAPVDAHCKRPYHRLACVHAHASRAAPVSPFHRGRLIVFSNEVCGDLWAPPCSFLDSVGGALSVGSERAALGPRLVTCGTGGA